MPAVAALGPLILAFMAALLAIAASLLIRAIAAKIPNPGFLGITLHLANIFSNIADDVVDWAIHNLDNYYNDLANWFTAHILVHLQFFGAVVSAISHVGDQIAHVVNTSIPNAISAAESAAGKVAHDLFNTAETGIKAAGARIDNLISHTIPDAIHTAEGYADSAVSDLHTLVRQEIATAKAAVESDLATAKTDLTRSISTLADTVASDFTQAKAIAQSDATAALNTAKGLIDTAKQDAETFAEGAADRVQTNLNTAINTIGDTIANLTGTVSSDFTAAETFATNQVAAGLQDVHDVLSGVAVTVGGVIGAAASGVASDISGVAAQAQADATAALNTASSALDSALGDIYTDLTGRSLAYNGDLTQVAGAVGLAITGAIAGVATRVTHLEECSVGVCNDSPNNFGNLLKDALGFTELAGVGLFLTKAIDDPAGIIPGIATDVESWRAEGQTALDALLSL
jgi:hypothetical protein